MRLILKVRIIATIKAMELTAQRGAVGSAFFIQSKWDIALEVMI